MQYSPAKQEEDDYAAPEYPLVLACPSLYLADSISAYSQRVGYAIEPPLGTLQDLPLLSQVGQDCAPSVQEVIQLVIGVGKE